MLCSNSDLALTPEGTSVSRASSEDVSDCGGGGLDLDMDLSKSDMSFNSAATGPGSNNIESSQVFPGKGDRRRSVADAFVGKFGAFLSPWGKWCPSSHHSCHVPPL